MSRNEEELNCYKMALPIYQELKVLRPMQSPEKVAEVVLLWYAIRPLRHRVYDKYKQELQAICDKHLLWIFEHNVIVGYPP